MTRILASYQFCHVTYELKISSINLELAESIRKPNSESGSVILVGQLKVARGKNRLCKILFLHTTCSWNNKWQKCTGMVLNGFFFDWTGTTEDKSKVKISQNFVAFSEYMNFTEPPLQIYGGKFKLIGHVTSLWHLARILELLSQSTFALCRKNRNVDPWGHIRSVVFYLTPIEKAKDIWFLSVAPT